MNQDTLIIHQKLASQRLAPGNSQTNLLQFQHSNQKNTPSVMAGSNFGQSPTFNLQSNPSEKELRVKSMLTPLAGQIPRTDFDSF